MGIVQLNYCEAIAQYESFTRAGLKYGAVCIGIAARKGQFQSAAAHGDDSKLLFEAVGENR